jgi:hypothetical protein
MFSEVISTMITLTTTGSNSTVEHLFIVPDILVQLELCWASQSGGGGRSPVHPESHKGRDISKIRIYNHNPSEDRLPGITIWTNGRLCERTNQTLFPGCQLKGSAYKPDQGKSLGLLFSQLEQVGPDIQAGHPVTAPSEGQGSLPRAAANLQDPPFDGSNEI